MSRPSERLPSIAGDSAKRVQAAQEALGNADLHPLRRLEVEAHDDVLVISGIVSSYYQKQMAQEVVRAVCRGIQLRNIVDVEREES